MPVAIDLIVLEKAQVLALECEKKQHPNGTRTWEDMLAWLKNNWIEKAQRRQLDEKQSSINA